MIHLKQFRTRRSGHKHAMNTQDFVVDPAQSRRDCIKANFSTIECSLAYLTDRAGLSEGAVKWLRVADSSIQEAKKLS